LSEYNALEESIKAAVELYKTQRNLLVILKKQLMEVCRNCARADLDPKCICSVQDMLDMIVDALR
jgi:tRNA1(Val) A37 N6-methylase TrmN6